MKKFNLGSKVVVSDPCYEIPTWCHAVVEDVLPGTYVGEIVMSDEGAWGNRVASLKAIHEEHHLTSHRIKWENHPATIGVDSGQCGIFNFDQYRDDKQSDSYDIELMFSGDWSSKPGDDWYQRMCTLTNSDEEYGVTPDGIVSCTGFGDGAYTLMVGKIDDNIVGFEIIYINPEDEEDDGMDEEDGD